MGEAKCKGCGKAIIWGETSDGKHVPLDPRPPVYRMENRKDGFPVAVRQGPETMVSHFATCREADRFSGSKRKAVAP